LYYWVDVLDRLIPFRPSQMIGKFVEGETLKQSDRIVVINDKLKDYVTGLGAPPELTHVLRAGIDTGQFNPDSNHREVRKQHGFKEDDIILFFMGWLYDFSGLKEVVLKFAQIKNDKLKLLIVGDGDLFNELKEIQNKYNLEGKIMLVGKKTYQEIPDFIAAANICLLPAYPWEPIMQDIVPIKMYEYMAMKKPVITTRLPGVMKEFGEDNGVVYVDTPDDVIAKAMQLMQNGKVAELGLKARKLVERYSWDKITDEFEKIMVKALEEKGNERLSKRV
ncbi:MAG: glycosyltransferase family 4 protein, partial [Dehalococcoidales bacterium]